MSRTSDPAPDQVRPTGRGLVHLGSVAVAPDQAAVASRTRGDWIKACTIGELIGFIPPALTGVVLFALDAPEGVLVAALVVAGIAEGAILGAAQSRVITQLFPRVKGWTTATAIAAGIAWLAGMGGSSLVQAVGPVALLVVIPGWIVGLLAMGLLQWRRLRPVADRAVIWIPYTVLAWLVGVFIPVIALSVIPNSAPVLVHGAVAVISAVAMGMTVGAITSRPLHNLATT